MKYIQILSALLTPLIAMITTYIAVQQYRNNRAKSRHELYEKRLKIYQGTTRYIRQPRLSPRLLPDDILTFADTKGESRFLFGREVTNYLDELDERGMRLHRHQLILMNMPELQDNSHMNGEIKQLKEWFEEQERKTTDIFIKYLDLKKIKIMCKKFIPSLTSFDRTFVKINNLV